MTQHDKKFLLALSIIVALLVVIVMYALTGMSIYGVSIIVVSLTGSLVALVDGIAGYRNGNKET